MPTTVLTVGKTSMYIQEPQINTLRSINLKPPLVNDQTIDQTDNHQNRNKLFKALLLSEITS